ncbi:MAG: SUMF1/EgtB/PvdO family nonheme iron enzyme [Elusimicrobia bacterium]|nr:SUMF1/EgtB/PvdO family nonheme iron enzyme [Elusimicrobiota bacterium]
MSALLVSMLFLSLAYAADAPGVSSETAPSPGGFADMALVPAGEFWMGSPEGEGYSSERPRHKVYLDEYRIDTTEVTTAQYREFAKATGRQLRQQPCPDSANCPVLYVNWDEAQAYCRSLGKRLPTEAEWEKAARGGSEGRYFFGDKESLLGEYAWFWDNSGRKVHHVGLKKPNPYGLYDVYGNAQEWTADRYDATYYGRSPRKNPKGPFEGGDRVVRGGSAFVSAELCRSAQRMKGPQLNRYSGRGFRCAASTEL